MNLSVNDSNWMRSGCLQYVRESTIFWLICFKILGGNFCLALSESSEANRIFFNATTMVLNISSRFAGVISKTVVSVRVRIVSTFCIARLIASWFAFAISKCGLVCLAAAKVEEETAANSRSEVGIVPKTTVVGLFSKAVTDSKKGEEKSCIFPISSITNSVFGVCAVFFGLQAVAAEEGRPDAAEEEEEEVMGEEGDEDDANDDDNDEDDDGAGAAGIADGDDDDDEDDDKKATDAEGRLNSGRTSSSNSFKCTT